MAQQAPLHSRATNDFIQSYTNSATYPTNLLEKSISSRRPETLFSSYKDRLDTADPDLFVANDAADRTSLTVIDVTSAGFSTKSTFNSDRELRVHLGDIVDEHNPTLLGPNFPQKSDPRCRLVFMPCKNQMSPLKLSLVMLRRVLSFHQVMPSFLDFLFVFGLRAYTGVDTLFSGFRMDVVTRDSHPAHFMPDMGRSGCRFQVCYNIRTAVVFTLAHTWSIRQAAVHHQFDLRSGNQVWITGDPHGVSTALVGDQYYPQTQALADQFNGFAKSFRTSLNIHLSYIIGGTTEWRRVIRILEDDILRELITKIRQKVPEPLDDPLGPDNLAILQGNERKAVEVLVVLESNENSIQSLENFYENQTNVIKENTELSKKELELCSDSVANFLSNLKDLLHETRMEIKHTKILIEEFSDSKTLLLQRLQAKQSAKTERLNKTMENLAVKTEREAIAMRIITVITLIYLPPTAVSTFFSAGIFESNTDNAPGTDNGKPSWDASITTVLSMRNAWLASALPLTFVTVVGAYYWFDREKKKIKAMY